MPLEYDNALQNLKNTRECMFDQIFDTYTYVCVTSVQFVALIPKFMTTVLLDKSVLGVYIFLNVGTFCVNTTFNRFFTRIVSVILLLTMILFTYYATSDRILKDTCLSPSIVLHRWWKILIPSIVEHIPPLMPHILLPCTRYFRLIFIKIHMYTVITSLVLFFNGY